MVHSEKRKEQIRTRIRSAIGIAAIALVGTVAFTWGSLNPPNKGLPAESELELISGRLMERHWGYRSYTIRMRLGNDPRTFIYTEKMGDKLDVWKALCEGCAVTLWIGKDDQRSEPFAYQIAVGARTVRSYRDVSSTWISDNKETPYLAVAFLIATIAATSYGLYQWRILPKGAGIT